MNLKSYKEAIQSINQDGKTLVAVQDIDGGYLFYVVTRFEAASSNPATLLSFNTLEGKDVTDIMTNLSTANDHRALINNLNQRLERAPRVRLEFSTDVRWYKFGVTAAGNNF